MILWDRPSSGASSFVVRDTPSEWHLWCDVLHGMCRAIEALPAYFGGGSAGSTLSLLMAHLCPQDVRGVVLQEPPDIADDPGRALIRNWYHVFAEAAERGGMEAVLRASENPPDPDWAWISCRVAQNVQANPDNRRRVLDTDPRLFARVMRRWGDWSLTGGLHRADLTVEELSRVRVPAIVGPGWDELHPEHAARDLFQALPNASWVDFAAKWSPGVVEKHLAGGPYQPTWPYLPFYQDFLARVEAANHEASP